MRPIFALALLALALPAAVPIALATSVCAPSCEIHSSTLPVVGFLTPFTVVASGSTVTWSSLDTHHTVTHSALRAGAKACFSVDFTTVYDALIAFAVRDGRLFATPEGQAERECDGPSVRKTPDGGAAIDYYCVYHSRMTGTLVVR